MIPQPINTFHLSPPRPVLASHSSSIQPARAVFQKLERNFDTVMERVNQYLTTLPEILAG